MNNKKIKYKYHHIGIPTNKPQKNERFSTLFKMYTSDAENSEFKVQYHRYEKDSPLPEILKKNPHVAFKVKNLDEYIKNKKVILEPYYPLEGFKVAIIEDGGIPIELIETNLTDEAIWKSTSKKSVLYPDNKK